MTAKNAPTPEAIVVTQDLSLVHVATIALPKGRTTWCQTFSSALTHLGPATKLLVIDAALDGPMASLMAALFVDHRPDRRVVVVAGSSSQTASPDTRITTLGLPLSWPALLGALHETARDMAATTVHTTTMREAAAAA